MSYRGSSYSRSIVERESKDQNKKSQTFFFAQFQPSIAAGKEEKGVLSSYSHNAQSRLARAGVKLFPYKKDWRSTTIRVGYIASYSQLLLQAEPGFSNIFRASNESATTF